MKASLILVACLLSASALAQSTPVSATQPTTQPHKPRVFVTAMETRESRGLFERRREALSGDQTTQTTEVQKSFVRECPGVFVTVKQDKAEYTFSLARQSASSRGLAGKRDKWTLADKDGDLIGGNSVHTIGNAVKDACALIAKNAVQTK